MPVSAETMNELSLRLTDGTVLALPRSLEAITTYVILEQEAWFEKEIGFLLHWLRPGMTVIDIGANLGVYSLPMARRVGAHSTNGTHSVPGGAVFAYEPASQSRRFLELSAQRNGVENLHVVAAAMSDSARQGFLKFGVSSELHMLGEAGSGAGETVRITTLDEEDRLNGWKPDFIKIDAEGEEERIIAGGRDFFTRHSPLVMAEIKAGGLVNENLLVALRELGYGIYRSLPDVPLLVRDDTAPPLDISELNLFGAKPDRAAALAREGFLVEELTDWTPDAAAYTRALDILKAQAFAPGFVRLYDDAAHLDPDYHDGLAGYAAWRASDVPPSTRYAALLFAFRKLNGLCQRAATLARLATLARAAWEVGQRGIAVNALHALLDGMEKKNAGVHEPFWPPNPRFDRLAVGPSTREWFIVGIMEQLERAASHSTIYGPTGIDLAWLSQRPFASAEIERRQVLQSLRAGGRITLSKRLCEEAGDHINADVWRSGAIPNTLVPDFP